MERFLASWTKDIKQTLRSAYMPLALPDTTTISRSPVRVTKSPGLDWMGGGGGLWGEGGWSLMFGLEKGNAKERVSRFQISRIGNSAVKWITLRHFFENAFDSMSRSNQRLPFLETVCLCTEEKSFLAPNLLGCPAREYRYTHVKEVRCFLRQKTHQFR